MKIMALTSTNYNQKNNYQNINTTKLPFRASITTQILQCPNTQQTLNILNLYRGVDGIIKIVENNGTISVLCKKGYEAPERLEQVLTNTQRLSSPRFDMPSDIFTGIFGSKSPFLKHN